jgi:hypothetical protein
MGRVQLRLLIRIAAAGWLAALPFAACAGPPRAVDFARDGHPLLQRACFECHGRQQQKGKLWLDAREFAFQGGRSGRTIVPGSAEASELYRRITAPRGSEDIMPARGEPLSAPQVHAIRARLDAVCPASLELVGQRV